MKRIGGFLFAVSVVAGQPLHAQQAAPALHPDRLLLKWAPLTLFDPSTCALMLGAEFRPVPRWGVEVLYGFRFTPLQVFSWNQDKENLRYRKFKLETRYYFPHSASTQYYAAAEAFYVPQEYDLKNGNFERNGEFRAYERAHIEREVRGAAVKAGLMRRLGGRFWLDTALGLGVRHREVRYHTVNERPGNLMFDSPEQNFLKATPDPGTRTRLAPAAAIRLGYTVR